jgi:hypothetical protein
MNCGQRPPAPDPRDDASGFELDTVRRLRNPEFALHYLREQKAERIALQARVEALEAQVANQRAVIGDHVHAAQERDQARAEREEWKATWERERRFYEVEREHAERLRQALELIRGYGRFDKDTPEQEIAYVRETARQALAPDVTNGAPKENNSRADVTPERTVWKYVEQERLEAFEHVARAAGKFNEPAWVFNDSWRETEDAQALYRALSALRACEKQGGG